MSRTTIWYWLWCAGVVGLFAYSVYNAYSPFASGGRTAARAGAYGPQHK